VLCFAVYFVILNKKIIKPFEFYLLEQMAENAENDLTISEVPEDLKVLNQNLDELNEMFTKIDTFINEFPKAPEPEADKSRHALKAMVLFLNWTCLRKYYLTILKLMR